MQCDFQCSDVLMFKVGMCKATNPLRNLCNFFRSHNRNSPNNNGPTFRTSQDDRPIPTNTPSSRERLRTIRRQVSWSDRSICVIINPDYFWSGFLISDEEDDASWHPKNNPLEFKAQLCRGLIFRCHEASPSSWLLRSRNRYKTEDEE